MEIEKKPWMFHIICKMVMIAGWWGPLGIFCPKTRQTLEPPLLTLSNFLTIELKINLKRYCIEVRDVGLMTTLYEKSVNLNKQTQKSSLYANMV